MLSHGTALMTLRKNKNTACGCQRSADECLIVIKKSEKGHISDKNAFRFISFDSICCSFDSEHIFPVSSTYVQ